MSLYLGLDCSTQSLTAIVLDIEGEARSIAFEESIEFDRDLPHYKTTNGVFRGANALEVMSSPLMWAEALDRIMASVARSGLDVSSLRAVSGSGQQHGSVYLNASAAQIWSMLDPGQPLEAQIRGTFSRAESPIWMDESTRAQCSAIERALGGPAAVARLTGSRAFERFTGPQIRKFFEEQPDAYRTTDRIHLVSSYLASLLAGAHAPIDPGDGAGMNLMDIESLQWSPAALEATAPDLGQRLPPVKPSWTDVGPLASYWQDRYGFPAARVIAWSGDNPCSLVGTGLVAEGRIGISLGTSDTVFGFTREPHVDASGSHVFGSPSGGYMSLICFRNGSLARERIRNEYGLDWAGFSRALRAAPAGNRGAIMLPWFEPEITPPVAAPGVRRIGLTRDDPSANVRAVIEAQMMAMANHGASVFGQPVRRILATGGASANREILQVMADVFGAEVHRLAGGNSASLGAALRAFHAHELARGRDVPWDDVVAGFTDPPEDGRVEPIAAHTAIYSEMRQRYAEHEAAAQKAESTGRG